jgi:hypothetical protein
MSGLLGSWELYTTQFSRFERSYGSLLPTPSHRAARAAKGKGSGGPVRRRRKTGTLVRQAKLGIILLGESPN